MQQAAREAVEALARDTSDGGPAVLMGSPWVDDGKLYNACLLLEDGKVAGQTYKYDLPNYGVFDEKRVFTPGPMPGPFNIRGVRIGVPICEDIWTPDVVECLAETGGEILLVPNGSPFEAGKEDVRLNLVGRARDGSGQAADLSQSGRRAGRTRVRRRVACRQRGSLGRLGIAGLGGNGRDHGMAARRRDRWVCAPGERWAGEERSQSVYHAMMLGLRDYVNKNRFPGVVLGLSGGIDSALSAAVAVDALGADRVRCVMLPSRYTSQESLDDAAACAKLLGVPLRDHSDRSRGGRVRRDSGAGLSPGARPTRRKRTSSRASAA